MTQETETRDAVAIEPDPLDTLELYRWAVQDPETNAVVLRTMYERLRPGRQPVGLRGHFRGVRHVDRATSRDSAARAARVQDFVRPR
jgi:hypothetical protein